MIPVINCRVGRGAVRNPSADPTSRPEGRREWTCPVAVIPDPRPPIAAATHSRQAPTFAAGGRASGGTIGPRRRHRRHLGGNLLGEPSSALLAHFGAAGNGIAAADRFRRQLCTDRAARRQRSADSADRVLSDGQATGGLKRIQLERQRHGVNPPAFRARARRARRRLRRARCACATSLLVRRAATRRRPNACWSRDGVVDPSDLSRHHDRGVRRLHHRAPEPCGLTGQLLIRISPPAGRCHRLSGAGPRAVIYGTSWPRTSPPLLAAVWTLT